MRLMAFVFILSCRPGYALSRDQRLLNESLVIGGRVTAQNLVRGALDRATERQVASQAERTTARQATRAGAAFVFAVELGLSIDDYRKAKTDKDRTYAVLNGGVAMVGLAFPVAGLAAGAALTAIRLIDGFASAGLAKKLAEIHARTARYQEDAAREYGRMERARVAVYKWYVIQEEDALKRSDLTREYLNANCSDPADLNNLNKIDDCLKTVVQSVAQTRRRVDALNVLSQYAEREPIDEAIRTQVDILEKSERELDDAFTSYSKATAQVLTAMPPTSVYDAKLICLSRLDHLRTMSHSLILAPADTALQADSYDYQIDRGFLRTEAKFFEQSPCVELVSDDSEIDALFAAHHSSMKTKFTKLGIQ